MTSQKTIKQLETWGYKLLPPSHPQSLGYSGLLVLIHDDVNNPQFDPQAIHCMLGTSNSTMSRTVLKAGGEFSQVHKVGAGQIRLVDEAREPHHFFTFGGTLSAEHNEGETVYYFQSNAPILALRSHSVKSDFAAEAEAMLAQKLASSHLGDDAFTAQLAATQAEDLYRQALNYAVERHTKGLNDDLLHAVEAELKWMDT